MAEIRVPALGESVTEATIGKWFKKPGEGVAVDEPLVELETDKVTIEVPSPAAGVLADIAAKDGDTVAVGAVLGRIKEGAGGSAKAAAAATPGAHLLLPLRRRNPRRPRRRSPRRQRQNLPMRRSRPRCAGSLQNPASMPRELPARARMAVSPRATCSRQ